MDARLPKILKARIGPAVVHAQATKSTAAASHPADSRAPGGPEGYSDRRATMESLTHYAFRDVEPADAQFLLEMLRLTVAWQLVPTADGMPPPVLVPPYAFDDFGRPGDGGVVVTYDEEPVGACWYRLNLTARECDGRPVPEMSVAVMPAHRAHGIGGQLLDRAIAQARAAGHPAIDLVVELENPARGMYARRGFEPLGGEPDARDMRKVL